MLHFSAVLSSQQDLDNIYQDLSLVSWRTVRSLFHLNSCNQDSYSYIKTYLCLGCCCIILLTELG